MICFAGVALFAGCDKIAGDEYTIYVGEPLEWHEGTAFTAVGRAYVEKYTGPKCPNCPAADVTLDMAHQQYGDRVVLISVNHPTGQGEPFAGQPDMRTDAGTAWDNYFGIEAIPAAYINRDESVQYSGSMAGIVAAIGSALQHEPTVGVELECQYDTAARQVAITVNVCLVQDCADALTLTLALTEDSLPYRQIDGGNLVEDYVHNHMLRDVATDTWGADIDCSGTAGEARTATISYTLPDNVVPTHCNIVALVSNKRTRVVLNSAACRL